MWYLKIEGLWISALIAGSVVEHLTSDYGVPGSMPDPAIDSIYVSISLLFAIGFI